MRSFLTGVRSAAAIAVTGLVVAGCAQTAGTSSAPEAPASPAAQYQTQAGHYRELQRAGLTGNYPGFATHLNPEARDQIIAELTRSFGGRPFDVYTWKTEETPAALSRLIELRSQTGRLYVYVRLDRVPGGWHVATWEISRKRGVITAKI